MGQYFLPYLFTVYLLHSWALYQGSEEHNVTELLLWLLGRTKQIFEGKVQKIFLTKEEISFSLRSQ